MVQLLKNYQGRSFVFYFPTLFIYYSIQAIISGIHQDGLPHLDAELIGAKHEEGENVEHVCLFFMGENNIFARKLTW